MSTVITEKQKSAGEEEAPLVCEKLRRCLPPYKEMNYFFDLVCGHDSGNLIILGSSVPEEIILASGAAPYWNLGGSKNLSVLADDSVPRDTDPVSRAMLGRLLGSTGNFPKNGLILIPLVNDSSRKLAYMLKARGYQVHTVYIPPTQGETSDCELARQGEVLVETISKYTGKRITRRRLLEAQEKIALARRQIRHLMRITCDKPEALPGTGRMLILYSYYCTADLEEWSEHLRLLNDRIAMVGTPKSADEPNSVLLLGSPVYFPNYKIPFLIQDVGLNIGAHLDYTTERLLRSYCVDQTMTVETLMKSFYKRDCSGAHTENRSLFESVSKLLAKTPVDGVVYQVLKGQIEYDFELERLEELLSSHSIPVCRLETDYHDQDIEQLRIRLEAFQEVLAQRTFRKEARAV